MIITLALMLLPLMVIADINDNSPAYGMQFLQIPTNPVSAALGGTGIYAKNYPGAWMQNPAANVIDAVANVTVNHNRWLTEMNSSQLIYSNGNSRKHFGLAARILDAGEIENRDESGALIGHYQPMDANLMANFAYRLLPSHLLGINAGLLYEKLDASSSYGFNVDLGYIYLPPIMNTTLFASVRNLGTTSEMVNENIDLPVTYEAGAGYSLPVKDSKLSCQATLIKAIDTGVRGAVAAEFDLAKILALRIGYKLNYDAEDLTAGMGVNWHNVEVDYGWTAFSDQLNDTHSFGITYHF
jgi:hypothetical protein